MRFALAREAKEEDQMRRFYDERAQMLGTQRFAC
jgi:hypothetical protein